MLFVLGSINVDMVFELAHLPAPGETVLTPSFQLLPGGKGANQAAAAAKAGAETAMLGCVGHDDHGVMMGEILAEAGVDIANVTKGATPTGLAIIAVDETGENSIIVASGANLDGRAAQLDGLPVAQGATLLCQNEIVPDETARALIDAKARGARTILNMAPGGTLPEAVLRALDVLIVNEIELRAIAGDRTTSLDDLAASLARSHDLTCVLTRGAEGALVVTPTERLILPALEVEVVDTTGAGDTFSGVLAAALDQGSAMAEAAARAVAAAALCCEKLGAQTGQPDREAIDRAVSKVRTIKA